VNTDGPLSALTLVSALGGGLMAGVFFGFSSFVMKALARLRPAQGIAVMQSINVMAVRPGFLAVFLGTALTCVALTVTAVLNWHALGAPYRLLGSLLYLIGGFLVTILFNVPRNDALAAVDPESTEGAELWRSYVRGWTAWNHVRTAACFSAAAVLTSTLCR
jgi:uncharacterized membrane protein